MEECTHLPEELAARYGVSRDYVMRKARLHSWPHLRMGRMVRFTDSHIAAIDAMHEVAVDPQIAIDRSWGRKTRRSR